MNLLKTLTDADIGSDELSPEVFEDRTSSRAIIFNTAGEIALLHATKKNYHKLPGGGVEEGEDLASALKREVLEEIGCQIKNVRELGVVEEYRNKYALHQTSHCFLAELSGEKGMPNLEEDEIADGFETVWMTLDSAISTLESEKDIPTYEGKFIRLRELVFLGEAKKVSNP